VLDALALEGRLLVVLSRDDEAVWKSLRNLGNVHAISPGELNAYDVLVCDHIIFTTATLPDGSTITKGAGRSSTAGSASASEQPAAERSEAGDTA
jgi:large subunit ribosomal protein L4